MTHEAYVAQVRDEMERLAGLLGTPKDFYGWLMEMPDTAVTGYAGVSSSCPLATYIEYQDEEGLGLYVDQPTIGSPWGIQTYLANDSGGLDIVFVPLPGWCGEFAEAVDKCGANEEITALVARALLALTSVGA